jgi:SOS-response transcriptional repressor LexA
VKVLRNGKKVVAGEDSLIKVDGVYLEKIINQDGWLVNIEDVDEFENGDLIVVCTDGEVVLYIYSEKENNYMLGKINTVTTSDCIYNVKVLNKTEAVCWGETGVTLSLLPYAF